ncbi:MAG: ribosome-binding factor A [Proteobacteria bacterium]|nr:MAG: ribosome-binding factor A [Pseudomonadota bacterium]PIE39946.1 MAG: ribosome-binding factor A [Gammaproteobacteria bacterium]
MPKEYSRAERLADQIQRELAMVIQRELKDPRVGMVSINEVRVSKDLGYAEVYFTLVSAEELTETSDQVKETGDVLGRAAGFLRSQLGARLKLRTVPHLRFHFDSSVLRGRRLSSLIDKALDADLKMASRREDGELSD